MPRCRRALPLLLSLLICAACATTAAAAAAPAAGNTLQVSKRARTAYRRALARCMAHCGERATAHGACTLSCVSPPCYGAHFERYALEPGEVDYRGDAFRACAQRELQRQLSDAARRPPVIVGGGSDVLL